MFPLLKSELDPDASIAVEGNVLNFEGEMFLGIGEGSELACFPLGRFKIVVVVVAAVVDDEEATE